MEGRAIARPNTVIGRKLSRNSDFLQWRAGQLPGQTTAAGPGEEPRLRLQWRAGQLPGQTRQQGKTTALLLPTFNGGPGNCPAKHRSSTRTTICSAALQWRAGQLPGQTGLGETMIHSWDNLQWRAGQLPGQTSWTWRRSCCRWRPFNGGPGNCPAKPGSARR